MEKYIRTFILSVIMMLGFSAEAHAGDFVYPFASTNAYSAYWPLEQSYPGHEGVDYACPEGTPVYASFSGTVTLVHDGEVTKSCSGYGNNIIISSGNYTIRYAHLLAGTIEVGSTVQAGQKVGETSNTGYTTNTDMQCLEGNGYHLHYEVRHNDTPVNPYTYNGGLFKIDSDGSYHFKHEVIDCSDYSDYIDDTEAEFDSLIGNTNGSLHQYYQLGEYSDNVCIQDYHAGGSTNATAAIIYDYEGDAREAYLVRSGFWNLYANTCEGPAGSCNQNGVGDCGAPIGNEYSQGGNTARQDFQTCYFYWNGSSSSANPYPEVGPGWFENDNWQGEISYAFAEAYANNGARNDMGEATDVVDGAGVHHWGNNSSLPYVQDFDGGNYGWAILMYNEDLGNAYAIRTGFWDTYQNHGPGTYGPPCNDEYEGSDGKTYQDFEHYTFRFYNGNVSTQARTSGCSNRSLASEDDGMIYNWPDPEDQYLFIDTDQNGTMDPCLRREAMILCDENRDGSSDYAFSYGDGISATYFPTRFGVAVVFGYGTFYLDDDADGYTNRTITFGGSGDIGHYLGNGGALAIQRYTRYFVIDNNADGAEEWYYPFGWGLSNQHYYLADMDGDNVTDLVFREGNLFTVDTNQDGSDDFYFTYGWGDADDYYFADLDSDGTDEVMVLRDSTFYAILNQSISRTCPTCSNSHDFSFSYGNGL